MSDIDYLDYPSKIRLPNVELIIIDSIDSIRAERVIVHCKNQAMFGDIKFLTHLETKSQYKVEIPKIDNIEAYSKFMVRDLAKYVKLDHALIVQHDGFIVNKSLWTTEFFDYDYIGAPWHKSMLKPNVPHEYCVGNGGFSFRSKKLLNILSNDSTFDLKTYNPEDVVICQLYRSYLETKGIKFAPKGLAHRFSNEIYPWDNSFGQHGFFNLRR